MGYGITPFFIGFPPILLWSYPIMRAHGVMALGHCRIIFFQLNFV